MYLTDYKSNSHALTLYKSIGKINKGIPPTLVPKAEEPIKTMALPTVNSDSDTNLDQNATTKFSARKPTRTEAGRRRKPCLTSQRRDLSSYRSLTQLQKRCHLISNLGQTAQKSTRAGRSASRSRLSPPIKTTLTIFLLNRRETATQCEPSFQNAEQNTTNGSRAY